MTIELENELARLDREVVAANYAYANASRERRKDAGEAMVRLTAHRDGFRAAVEMLRNNVE